MKPAHTVEDHGRRQHGVTIMGLTSISPATGEAIETYRELTDAEIDVAIASTHAAWEAWRSTTYASRGALLRAAARVLRDRSDELAHLMALEMGKPLAQ